MPTTGELEISLKGDLIMVKVDGAVRAIDVWPPDNDYVTFQWL